MKKMVLNFAKNLLSKEEISKIKGGYGGSCGYCSSPGDPSELGTACETIPTPPSGYNEGCYCPYGGGCSYLA